MPLTKIINFVHIIKKHKCQIALKRFKKIKNKLIKNFKFQKNKYYNELFSKNNKSDNYN